MEKAILLPGVIISTGEPTPELMEHMDKATREWEMKAARGECGWICSDCGMGFSEGMPDKCGYDNQWCTDILKRDKQEAMNQS